MPKIHFKITEFEPTQVIYDRPELVPEDVKTLVHSLRFIISSCYFSHASFYRGDVGSKSGGVYVRDDMSGEFPFLLRFW